MPTGKYQWQFVGRTPRPILVLVVLLAINTLGVLGSWILLPKFALSQPDSVHTYEIIQKGGQHYYFTPAIGWYIGNCESIQFVILALIFVLTFTVYRRKVQRVR